MTPAFGPYSPCGAHRAVAWCAAALVLGFGSPLGAQQDPTEHLEHRFADARGLSLEYFQFGSAGTPVVVIQDHHDYFHDSTDEIGVTMQRGWVALLESLGETFTVIAHVRRGWGESEDPGWGYDVPTQAEDVLGLMDDLGIPQAVLVGRTAATQEMTWIAEHHPERVLALVYWQGPLAHLPRRDEHPEARRFDEMYNRGSCDIGQGEEVDVRLDPRVAWSAHFPRDPGRRIDLPALWLRDPVFDRGDNMFVRRINRLEAWDPEFFGDDAFCDAQAKEYFEALRGDTERIALLREEFANRVDGERLEAAMRSAFEDRLTIVWERAFTEDLTSFSPLARTLTEYISGLSTAR